MLNEFHRKLFDTIHGNDYVEVFADPARQVLNTEPYTYSIQRTGLALGATPQEFTITMDDDSEFVAIMAAGCGTVTTTPYDFGILPGAAILIQVRENWSGKTWFNTPTLLPLIAGQGGFPFIQSSPRVIPARSTITVEARAAHRDATYDGFHFSLHGGRIYYK